VRTLLICAAVLLALPSAPSARQGAARTLVAVFAHPDDEGSASPILARYAREGAQVHVIIATDGAAGGQQTTVPVGPELASVRAEEARCAAAALGIKPPILLGFPDGTLGSYADDPLRLFRVTQRLHEELQRLRPDALITWGPDGGTGHPDHRLVSAVVTQLVRTGAPGVPERLFYVTLPAEAMRVLNPTRPAPPLLIPDAKLLTTKIAVTAADLDAARRSLGCHKTQFPADAMTRLADVAKQMWPGAVPLAPAFTTASKDDLFR
jgi:LmbE family N-acetylglucosaminyl deacetylase